jgi:hypothetical protein
MGRVTIPYSTVGQTPSDSQHLCVLKEGKHRGKNKKLTMMNYCE